MIYLKYYCFNTYVHLPPINSVYLASVLCSTFDSCLGTICAHNGAVARSYRSYIQMHLALTVIPRPLWFILRKKGKKRLLYESVFQFLIA